MRLTCIPVCMMILAILCDGALDDIADGIARTKAFYDEWPYPGVIYAGTENALHAGQAADVPMVREKILTSLTHAEHWALRRSTWRELGGANPLRILVAPCAQGNDAAHFALQLRELHDIALLTSEEYNEAAGSCEEQAGKCDTAPLPPQLGEVVCLDQSSVAQRAAAEYFAFLNVTSLVTMMELDVHQLDPLAHGTFDLILCSGLLHHLPSPEAGLRAVRRVLAPGGALGLMVHASHGMAPVVEAQRLLQQLAPPSLGWARRLELARMLMASLRHRLPLGLRPNLDHMLADDHLTADFLLVPYQGAYTVRELGPLLASAGLCLVRMEPSWRYEPEFALAGVAHRMTGAGTHVSSGLANLSLADEVWASALNHRFYARVPTTRAEEGEVCAASADDDAPPRDPLDTALVPLFVWEPMSRELPRALQLTKGTDERLNALVALVTPNTYGTIFSLIGAENIEEEKLNLGSTLLRVLVSEVDAMPPDAAAIIGRAVGCEPFAALVGRAPGPREMRMYRTLETFFGLRLVGRAGVPYEENCHRRQ